MTSLAASGGRTGGVRFRGRRRTYAWLLARGAALLMVSLGLYRFWLMTDVRRFLWASTEIDGETLEYAGTPLELLLKFMKKDTLLIAGCNTNTCVLASVFGAYNRGLRAVVISDCVASAYGEDLHRFALSNIQRRLGWVLGLDELASKIAR